MDKDRRSKLDRVWRDSASTISEWKQRTGKKAIGLALVDVPEELIWAAGAAPVTIFSRDVPFQLADKHLQGFACSYSRSLTELAERGELDYLDGMVMPYSCDTTRCLDLIFKYLKRPFFYDCLRIPKRVSFDGLPKYFIAEMRRLAESLSKLTGQPVTSDSLRASIKAYNQVRAELAKIRAAMREGTSGVSASDYLSAVRAAMSLPPEDSLPLIEGMVSPGNGSAGKPRVVIAGKVAEPPALLDVIEGSGLWVAEDHLAAGGRWVEGVADEKKDPWEALVERHQARLPFAGIWTDRKSRSSYLADRLKSLKAQGAIILSQKFCEPLELDIPGIKRELEAEGFPLLVIETDYRPESLEPVKTRVEAFAEMLRDRV